MNFVEDILKRKLLKFSLGQLKISGDKMELIFCPNCNTSVQLGILSV